MEHLRVMHICDLLQDARDRMLELDEQHDAAMIELFYQKYTKLYHEYIRNLYESTPVSNSPT